MSRDLRHDLQNQVLGTINRFLIVDLRKMLWDYQIVHDILGLLVVGGKAHDPIVPEAVAVYMGPVQSQERNRSIYTPSLYGCNSCRELSDAICELVPAVQPYARLNQDSLLVRDHV